jgi:hypothetical protein
MNPSQPITPHQLPTQGPDPESGIQVKPRQETPTTVEDSGRKLVEVTKYLNMLLDEPGRLSSILVHVFMWIILAGFLVIPSSFPQIQKIVSSSGELSSVVQFTRNIGL